MNPKIRHLTHAAIIAALYAALCYLQDTIFIHSASQMIQFRVAEALCVLAFFTPAAIGGLSVGCALFNLLNMSMPLDLIMGTAASALAAAAMYATRKIKIFGYPLLGMVMPALFNGVLIGWMLTIYTPIGFWTNAMYVALGELAVLATLGSVLYYALKVRRLDQRLFQ